MEYPGSEWPCIEKLLISMKLASPRIGKYFLADRNGALDRRPDDLASNLVEMEVHYIEIVSTIDGSHEGHIFIPVVGELMPMPTQYTIDSALGQSVNELEDLVILAWLLHSLVGSDIVGFVPGAFIAKVSQYYYDLCSPLPQLLGIPDGYGGVLQKRVARELTGDKPGSRCGSLSCG